MYPTAALVLLFFLSKMPQSLLALEFREIGRLHPGDEGHGGEEGDGGDAGRIGENYDHWMELGEKIGDKVSSINDFLSDVSDVITLYEPCKQDSNQVTMQISDIST